MSALDYLYEVLLEIRESKNGDEVLYEDEFAIVPYVKHEIVAIAPILGSSFHEKLECNDFTINYLDVNCANNMKNPKLGDASFAMFTTCCNDHNWDDSSYDLKNLFKPHVKYEIDNNICNNIESGFGSVSTLDITYLENVQSYEIFDKSGFGEVMTLLNVNPTILEECQLCMHVDRVENVLCDSYFVNFLMIAHVIIMREENMIVKIFMLLNYLSLC